jgi:D-arabinose 1-dehydrogenase
MTQLAIETRFKLHDGHEIPGLGLGTVPPEDKSEIVQQVITAVKAGYRHIDTAWYYGSEPYIGQALKQLFDDKVVTRDELFITSKVWPSFWHSPEKSLDTSLKDLGVDYVDLFLQHWPICLHGDENGLPAGPKDKDGNLIYDDDPVDGKKYLEVYHELERIRDNTTKVRSIGVANYSIPRLKELLAVAKHKPVVNQVELHPQIPQKDLVKFCTDNQIHVTAYSPVGSTGAPVLKLPLIKKLAQSYNVTENEIALAYHILNGRSAIPRSSNLERIKTIIRLPQLTKDELAELDQIGIDHPHRYINDPWGYGIGFKWWDGDTRSKKFD